MLSIGNQVVSAETQALDDGAIAHHDTLVYWLSDNPTVEGRASWIRRRQGRDCELKLRARGSQLLSSSRAMASWLLNDRNPCLQLHHLENLHMKSNAYTSLYTSTPSGGAHNSIRTARLPSSCLHRVRQQDRVPLRPSAPSPNHPIRHP